MAKTIRSFKLADATIRQLDWLADHGYNGNRTAVVETAIDRMFVQEGGTVTRMNYEAPPEEIDAAVLARAEAIHAEVCYCDSKRCDLTNQIYQWLMAGDRGEGRIVTDLALEWQEYEAPEEPVGDDL
jgi:hypothetical protein